MTEHVFYFKLVYTDRAVRYSISPDKTLTDFINYVKVMVRDDFNISDNFNVEIVPTGQPYVPGQDAEMAAALEHSNYYTIRDIYGDNYKNISFYIRKIPDRFALRLQLPTDTHLYHSNNTPPAPRTFTR